MAGPFERLPSEQGKKGKKKRPKTVPTTAATQSINPSPESPLSTNSPTASSPNTLSYKYVLHDEDGTTTPLISLTDIIHYLPSQLAAELSETSAVSTIAAPVVRDHDKKPKILLPVGNDDSASAAVPEPTLPAGIAKIVASIHVDESDSPTVGKKVISSSIAKEASHSNLATIPALPAPTKLATSIIPDASSSSPPPANNTSSSTPPNPNPTSSTPNPPTKPPRLNTTNLPLPSFPPIRTGLTPSSPGPAYAATSFTPGASRGGISRLPHPTSSSSSSTRPRRNSSSSSSTNPRTRSSTNASSLSSSSSTGIPVPPDLLGIDEMLHKVKEEKEKKGSVKMSARHRAYSAAMMRVEAEGKSGVETMVGRGRRGEVGNGAGYERRSSGGGGGGGGEGGGHKRRRKSDREVYRRDRKGAMELENWRVKEAITPVGEGKIDETAVVVVVESGSSPDEKDAPKKLGGKNKTVSFSNDVPDSPRTATAQSPVSPPQNHQVYARSSLFAPPKFGNPGTGEHAAYKAFLKKFGGPKKVEEEEEKREETEVAVVKMEAEVNDLLADDEGGVSLLGL